MHALLALEDGRLYCGRAFGDPTGVGGEVVFCTSMTGYQEILTDPSYHGQIVVFTAAHVGNYGIHEDHGESDRPWVVGLVLRDLCDVPSHPDSIEGLREFARRHHLFGIHDVDTRDLTLHLREAGSLRGFCTTRIEDPEEAIAQARLVPSISSRNLVADVTGHRDRSVPGGNGNAPRVTLLDFGVKESIVRELHRPGCAITILPADAGPEQIDESRPVGIVLSNGPGDPQTLEPLVPTIRHCIERYPTLAICLGHQLAGLALGAKIDKLRFGHHGANHPVRDLGSGKVSITSQNHNYAIRPDSLPAEVAITHVNLNDSTVEGFAHRDRHLWSYQFHPEGGPGPHDARSIFEEFVSSIARGGNPGAA